MENDKALEVLLADDDPDDRMFFTDAMSGMSGSVNVQTVNDGEELMSFLLDPETSLPKLVFIDLNMPFKNGLQCLNEIRGNINLKELFVIIYSTSANQKEIEETFRKGANLFVNKPNTFTGLKIILAKILALNLSEYLKPDRAKFVLDTDE